MKTIDLGFDRQIQQLVVPEKNLSAVLEPEEPEQLPEVRAELRRALEHPIGTKKLRETVHPGEKIVIITSDITRPVPTWEMMPVVLEELYDAGIGKEDITLVFALGSHRKHTQEEMEKLAGAQAFAEITCMDSTPEDTVFCGITDKGTPIHITRVVAQADRRICMGNIEYHYFAGYSGGAKALVPGVATRAAIEKNHSLMESSDACAAKIEGNPVREDLEQGASFVGADFIINVVLNSHKRILKAFAGDLTQAHREGCKFLDEVYGSPIAQRADIVVVSQGGAPKDLNLYQTQKALDNAKHAVKDGGIIILVGSCREGFGEDVFQEWMTSSPSPEHMVERIGREFRLGGHKAAAIAQILCRAEIYLVSEFPPEQVKQMFMEPFCHVQAAFDAAMAKKGEDARVIVMPYGGSTLPLPPR